MELDIGKKSNGRIWHRKPNPEKDNGLIIKVVHSVAGPLSGPYKSVRFLKVSFDNSCDRFVAGDHQGHIYMFDLAKNRFTLVQRTGQACTALSFNVYRKNEFLIGLGDYTLKCFDTDSGDLVAWMKGHESAIHNISVHTAGHYAVTTSSETTHLWDLDTFQKKHKLNIKENIGLLQAFFLPNSNIILTCFCDDTIFAWDLDTMTCKYQLPVPPGKSPQYRAFAASWDARYLVAGGKSQFLHLWSLDAKQLIQVIEMPKKVTAIKQLNFLQNNYHHGVDQVLSVLSQDGIMRFINIDTCKLLFDIGTLDVGVRCAAIGPGGHHVAAVMEDGSLHIYSINALADNLNKPPPTIMRVVTNNTLSDIMSTESSMKRMTLSKVEAKDSTSLLSPEELKNAENEKEVMEFGGLNKEKLMAILKGYGEYPAKYRMFIWRKILQLPENFAAYAALVDKGVHLTYARLHEIYPIKSRKLLRVLQRVLSTLAHWSPIFGETQYLPSFAFPFVKLFQNNHLICFELIATIIVNWGQHWFEYFPNPPINILGMIENLVSYHDPQLLQHLVKHGVTSQIYAWPLLETVFSEVLTQDEWLMLWDNIFSNHPAFFIMTVVAYVICAQGPLMKCTEMDDFKFFFHNRNAVSIKLLVKEAYRLMEATPDDLHPQKKLEEFVSLTKGSYPVFNKYPKFIVDYQVQERERIYQEELEYLRQRHMTEAVQKEAVQKQQGEEQWYRQQKLLLEAEEKRRRMIQEEEAKLAEQRKRLLAMNREVKLKELTLLDACRQKFLHFQKEQRELELKRLDEELQRKALQRDQETETAMREAEIKSMELLLQKKLLEQELYRDFAIQSQALRTEQDMQRRQVELEDKLRQKIGEAERAREVESRKLTEQNLAQAEQHNIDMWAQKEMDHKYRMAELDREADSAKLASLTSKNKALEGEVYKLMKNCQRSKELETAQGYEAIAANRDKDHRMEASKDEPLHRQHHALDFMDSSESGDYVSFERNRRAFDDREVALLNEVRLLRQRLATENRNKRPPLYESSDTEHAKG